jgi:hypothetical protein
LNVRRGDGHLAYRLLDDPDLLDPWVSDFAADRRPIASRANALLAMGLSMWASAELAEEANRLVLITPYDAMASVQLDETAGSTGPERGRRPLHGVGASGSIATVGSSMFTRFEVPHGVTFVEEEGW